MPLTRVQRRFTAWLVMLVMALWVLAPTLAQAVVARSDQGDWVQVCSASGMFWIQVDRVGLDDASPASDGLPTASMGMQCPWCQLHSPAAAPSPASTSLALTAAPAQWLGDASAAPPPPGIWPAAPARAPPLSA